MGKGRRWDREGGKEAGRSREREEEADMDERRE